MPEFFINLFDNRPAEGKRPHFTILCRIDGVEHECALWPAKDGKKGFSGKMKEKEIRVDRLKDVTHSSSHSIVKANAYQPQTQQAVALDDEIPF
jgi:hypothetical protein